VITLTLLLLMLVSLSHWLLEPCIRAATSVLEIAHVPWLLLGAGAWLIAGREQDGANPKP
jgi:hypothetical protein